MGDILATRTNKSSAYFLVTTKKTTAWWQRAGLKVVVDGVRRCLSHPSLQVSCPTLFLFSFLALLPHSLDLVPKGTAQVTGALPTTAASVLAQFSHGRLSGLFLSPWGSQVGSGSELPESHGTLCRTPQDWLNSMPSCK